MTAAGGTRCSLLTPPGTGAIAVIRLDGPDAEGILRQVFCTADFDAWHRSPAGHLAFGHIQGSRSESLDDVLVARTGDAATNEPSAFDITTHGGVRVVERIIDRLQGCGANHAAVAESPGHVWHCTSMIEREAIQALCAARTERAVRFLAYQRGALAPAIEAAAVQCEAGPNKGRDALSRLTRDYPAARFLMEGARVALIGPPNGGKSTLFNRLSGRAVAVVSDSAGTTRDWVCENVEMAGVPIELVDTAGRRATGDSLEQAAIHAGRTAAERADILLVVIDASTLSAGADWASYFSTDGAHAARIVVLNKVDLVEEPPRVPWAEPGCSTVGVSAIRGDGVGNLVSTLVSTLGAPRLDDSHACVFTGRQGKIVAQALAGLDTSPKLAVKMLRTDLIGK